jgi:hypothetical protein
MGKCSTGNKLIMRDDRKPSPSGKNTFLTFIFNPFAALLLVPTIVLAVVYFCIAWKYIAKEKVETDIVVESQQCVMFRDRAQHLRQQFEKIDTGDPSAILTKQQTEYAAQLLNVRARYVSECQSGNENDNWYNNLRQRYETTMSQDMMNQSAENEKNGDDAISSGNYREAYVCYKRAYDLQNRINTEFPSSTHANSTRYHALEKFVDDAHFRPLIKEFQNVKEAGDLAYDRSDYEKARERYVTAINLLRNMAYQIPPSYFNCEEKIRTLSLQTSEIGAKIRSREIDSLLSEADAASASGDFDKASAIFAQIFDKQRLIVKDFPQSTMAGSDRNTTIEKRRQNALSKPLAQNVASNLTALAIAMGKYDDKGTQEAICNAQLFYGNLLRQFPLSDAAKNTDFKKIPFLFSIRTNVCLLRKAVMEHLKPIPDDREWRMLDREISQLMYTKICSGNPSARKADNLPVEGVTLAEAQQFAQRMSWIIGLEVRLPDLNRYLAAVKPIDTSWVRKNTWNSVTAPGREVQPVASSTADARGFYDLLGNVSEWIAPDDFVSEKAIVAGGNVRDNPIRISEIPQEEYNVTERIRNNGFRLIVKNGGR